MKVKTYTIDLREQMAVCDANYIRLLKLLGKPKSKRLGMQHRVIDLPQLGGNSSERISVSLEVQEDFRYTSTVVIRQLVQEPSATTVIRPSRYQAPEMVVRVYHDAMTAEVVSYQNHRHFKAIYPVPNQFMYQSDEKEQLNLFLAEWLNLCINEGLWNPDAMRFDRLACQ